MWIPFLECCVARGENLRSVWIARERLVSRIHLVWHVNAWVLSRVTDKWKEEVRWLGKEVENTQGFLTEARGCRGFCGAKDPSGISWWPCRRRGASPSKSKLLPRTFLSKIVSVKLCLFVYLFLFPMHERTGDAVRRSLPASAWKRLLLNLFSRHGRLRQRQHLFVAVIHPDLEPCEHLLLRPRADLCCGEKGKKRRRGERHPNLHAGEGRDKRWQIARLHCFFSLSLSFDLF